MSDLPLNRRSIIMDDPILNNRSFFSSYHLEKVLTEETSNSLESIYKKVIEIYSSIEKFAKNLNESQTQEKFIDPVLKLLGHTYQVEALLTTSIGALRPDYAFFSDDLSLKRASIQINTIDFFKTATAVGDAKSWGLNLDKKLSGGGNPFDNSNPNYQIDMYIRKSGCKWGILTNGILWRLYHRDSSYNLDSFYEVNLEQILKNDDVEDFRYFYYLFRKEAFTPKTHNLSFLDNVLSQSINYNVSVSDNLGDNIYSALEELINGFLSFHTNCLSSSDTNKIHENCLILLYRLLFILY